MLNNSEAGEALRWNKFPLLNDGFVCLVDWMGDDSSVVQAARVSYGVGTKQVSDDRTLIRYLYRHAHTTPFEMCEVKLLIRIPMDAWRQYIRHRTASVNEYSTRYSEAIDARQETAPDAWRLQSGTNKQGSSGFVTDYPEGYSKSTIRNCAYDPPVNEPCVIDEKTDFVCGDVSPGEYLSDRERWFHQDAQKLYAERLKFGVAREQARKDLPLSTYTEAYWKCDLKNLFNFLSLRMDAHAQLEIRSYADVIGKEIVAKLFPMCWEAFNDYDLRRGALLLSALDVEVIRRFTDPTRGGLLSLPVIIQDVITNKREQAECEAKLRRLGLVRIP